MDFYIILSFEICDFKINWTRFLIRTYSFKIYNKRKHITSDNNLLNKTIVTINKIPMKQHLNVSHFIILYVFISQR